MINDKVLVIGSMNYDSFYTLPKRMRIGENLHATNYQTSFGGKGANQAVQCAKLNLNTTMYGALGHDNYGDQIYDNMIQQGVKMLGVKRVSLPTGNASVWVYPDSEVQAVLFGGANMSITKQDIDNLFRVIKEHRIVVLQNEIPLDAVEHAAVLAKQAGCYVIYNAAPALKVSPDLLKAVDLFIVNESEASFYSETDITDLSSARQSANCLKSILNGTLIITLGSIGSLIVEKQKDYFIPAKRVQAVETTGAGDSYVGTLAYGIIKNMAIFDAAQLATNASAITVSSFGAQSAMPTLEQLLKSNNKIQ